MLIMGSMARVMPGLRIGAGAAFAEIWNLRFFVEMSADAMADEFADDGVAVGDCLFFDVRTDVAEPAAGLDALDGAIQNLLGDGKQAFRLGIDDSDRDAHRGVADPAVADDADIHFDDVAVADFSWSADAVDDFFVDRDADVSREFLVAEEGALDARFAHELGGGSVDLAGGDAGSGESARRLRISAAVSPARRILSISGPRLIGIMRAPPRESPHRGG